MEEVQYIKVILPLKLAWEPCYRISEEVRTGARVSVTFAGRKYIGVVSATGVTPEVDPARVLPVDAVERHMEPIGEKELALWRFMADYYLCTIGEVYKMAYPAVKTAGEEIRARAEERRELMNARTVELYRKRILALEARLSKKDAALAGRHNAKVTAELEAGRDRILAELREVRNKLEALDKKGLPDKPVTPDVTIPAGGLETAETQAVLKAFRERKTVLLQGGTARVKVIVEIAGRVLSEGHSVLMLVPEITLSKRLQAVLTEAFGDAVLVFHSAEI